MKQQPKQKQSICQWAKAVLARRKLVLGEWSTQGVSITYGELCAIDNALVDGELAARNLNGKHGYPPKQDIDAMVQAQEIIRRIIDKE